MYLGNLEIRRSRAWTGETGGQYRTPFSLTVCTHTHSPTCNLIQAFTGSAVLLRKTDLMDLSAFLMISLIYKIKMGGLRQKNFYGDVPVNRLYGGEHVIDLASSVERSIHCVWPRAHVLTAYYRKRAKEKIEICIKFNISDMFRSLSWRNWWVRGPWGHDLFSSLVIRTVLYLLTLSAFVRSPFFISIFPSPFSHMRCISSHSVSPRCHSNSFLEKREGERFG